MSKLPKNWKAQSQDGLIMVVLSAMGLLGLRALKSAWELNMLNVLKNWRTLNKRAKLIWNEKGGDEYMETFYNAYAETLYTPLTYKHAYTDSYEVDLDWLSVTVNITPWAFLILVSMLVLLFLYVLAVFMLGENVRYTVLATSFIFICAFGFLTSLSFWVSMSSYLVLIILIGYSCWREPTLAGLNQGRIWLVLLASTMAFGLLFLLDYSMKVAKNGADMLQHNWTMYYSNVPSLYVGMFLFFFIFLFFFFMVPIFYPIWVFPKVLPTLSLDACLMMFGTVPLIATYGAYKYMFCWRAEVGVGQGWLSMLLIIATMMSCGLMIRDLRNQYHLKVFISYISAMILHLGWLGFLVSPTTSGFLAGFMAMLVNTFLMPAAFMLSEMIHKCYKTYNIKELALDSSMPSTLAMYLNYMVTALCLSPGTLLCFSAYYSFTTIATAMVNFAPIKYVLQVCLGLNYPLDLTLMTLGIVGFIYFKVGWSEGTTFNLLSRSGQPSMYAVSDVMPAETLAFRGLLVIFFSLSLSGYFCWIVLGAQPWEFTSLIWMMSAMIPECYG